jgi:hypothetical protein
MKEKLISFFHSGVIGMHLSFRTLVMYWALIVLGGLLVSHVYAQGSGQVTGEIILTLESNMSKMLPYTPQSPTTGTPEAFRTKDTATLKVCIQNGRARVGDVIREFTLIGEKDLKTVEAKTDCTPIHPTRSNIDIRRPGNWRRESTDMKVLLMPPEEAEKKFNMKLESRVNFTPRDVVRPRTREERKERSALKASVIGGLPKGKYNVSVHTESAVSFSGYMRSESHNVCTGITTSYFIRYLPDDPSKEQFSKVDRGEHSTSILSIVPYKKYPLVGSWEIDYDPNGSGGSEIIWQIKKRETDSTLSVQWSFKPNNPCQRLAIAIEHDLTYAEGYLDKTARQKASDQYKKELEKAKKEKTGRPKFFEIYSCYVDRYVYERDKGFPPPAGELDCENPQPQKERGVGNQLYVNEKCILVGEPEYRKRTKDSCTPDGIVIGVIAHEKTHVEQCLSDPDRYNTIDPAVFGDMEVAAHLVGISKMLESLKRLCPNYDTTSYEIRMETINHSRLKP